MLALLRRFVKAEDLLWALWLAVLRPAVGGLFLDGGVATGFLTAAAGLYWVTGLVGERDGEPLSGGLLFVSLAVCTILLDAGIKQLEVAPEWMLVHAAAVLVLGVVITVAHTRTGGRMWWTLPRRYRRVLAWPMVMAMAEFFGQMMAAFVDARGAGGLVQSSDEPLFIAFTLVLVFGLVMPVVYAFFVVGLRKAADSRESADPLVWASRYGWAVVWALIGVYVVSPALAWAGLEWDW